MRWSALIFFVAGALAVGPSALALEPKTWDYAGSGQWPLAKVPAASTTQGQAVENPTLDRAERLLAGKQNRADDAESQIVAWVKSHRTAPDRDRGLFLLAEAYYQQGDRIRAFYQLDELLVTYPESKFYYPALEKQYRIADDFLRGAKRKFLGLYIIPATDEAIEMLYRIQERSPGSPLAERAMLRTADYYYNTGQFDLAGDVYTAYQRAYPRSPEVPRVSLRRAFSAYAQFHGVKFDSTPLIEARAQFEDIKVRYPEMAQEENVQRFIDAINDTLARKLLTTADFYRRTRHPGAAVYTYREVVQVYPNTREARAAEDALRKSPPAALAMPPPKSTTAPFDVAASTRPAEPGPTLRSVPTPRVPVEPNVPPGVR
jgi:outer membrane assembly lipoprotein YfiO